MKQKVLLIALAVLFVFSLTAYAVMPSVQSAPTVKGVNTIAMLKAFDSGRTFHPPSCPDAGPIGGC